MSETNKKPIRLTDYTEFCGIRVSPLAIALAESPEWLWRTGMVAVAESWRNRTGDCLRNNPFLVEMGTLKAGQPLGAWFRLGSRTDIAEVSSRVVPDIFHPSMIGWLAWILHGYEPNAVVLPFGPGKPCRVVVVGEDDSFRVLAVAPTTGEALARAILLLWGVEVVDGDIPVGSATIAPNTDGFYRLGLKGTPGNFSPRNVPVGGPQ